MIMKQRRHIQSITRAIKIIDYISKNNNSRLVDISKNLQLHKSTLYGIISTLEDKRVLSKNCNNNTYSLGKKLYELGKIYEKNFSVKECIRPYLQKISNKFKETVLLAIERDFNIIYIDKFESNYTIGVTSTLGSREPLQSTAVGKIFLAYMDKNRLKTFFKIRKLIKLTKNTITDKKKLKQQFNDIKNLGYSYEIEETEEGLVCVAAPVKLYDDKVIASIVVSAPLNRMSNKKIEQIGNELSNTCAEISWNIKNMK